MIHLNLETKRAMWDNKPVALTLGEFGIVRLFIANLGEDLSYRRIYDVVKGEGFITGKFGEGHKLNVRASVKRIRKKFILIDADFDCIKNYWGFGYRWDGNAVIEERKTA